MLTQSFINPHLRWDPTMFNDEEIEVDRAILWGPRIGRCGRYFEDYEILIHFQINTVVIMKIICSSKTLRVWETDVSRRSIVSIFQQKKRVYLLFRWNFEMKKKPSEIPLLPIQVSSNGTVKTTNTYSTSTHCHMNVSIYFFLNSLIELKTSPCLDSARLEAERQSRLHYQTVRIRYHRTGSAYWRGSDCRSASYC